MNTDKFYYRDLTMAYGIGSLNLGLMLLYLYEHTLIVWWVHGIVAVLLFATCVIFKMLRWRDKRRAQHPASNHPASLSE